MKLGETSQPVSREITVLQRLEEDFCILSPVIAYNQRQLRDIAFSSSKEWLLADGEGGFACSTVSFMNTRRQHSLLTVSLTPPLKRLTLLNKIDEEVISEGKSYFLGTNHYPDTIFPEGYKFLSKFTFDYFPEVIYDLSGSHISKCVLMPKRSSSVYIHYENHSKKTLTLRLLPLVSFRMKDSLRKSDESFLIDELPDGIRIIADMNLPKLYLKLSHMYNTSPESHWYYDFIYPHDSGLYKDERENLFNMGYWEVDLEPEKGVTLAASTRDLGEFDYTEIKSRYIEAADKVRFACGLPKKFSHLANSASNHIAFSNALRTPAIIEGYPYGGIDIVEALGSLDGISHVAESRNFDQGFFHELASSQLNGSFPTSIDEETSDVNYGKPETLLYLAFAMTRHADKGKGFEFVRRYLPLLEAGIESIMAGRQEGDSSKASPLLDLGMDSAPSNANRASVNALWYNLLRLVDDTKSAMQSSSVYSETASEIASIYYDSFFESDGNYKNSDERNGMTSDMAIPLIVPRSPLDEEQKSKVCRALVSRFFDLYGDQSSHDSSHHSCNLDALYLLEASSHLKGCEKEVGNMRWYIDKLFAQKEFTNCVNGIPKCGYTGVGQSRRDISSAIAVGEAIRLIKKLKLK